MAFGKVQKAGQKAGEIVSHPNTQKVVLAAVGAAFTALMAILMDRTNKKPTDKDE